MCFRLALYSLILIFIVVSLNYMVGIRTIPSKEFARLGSTYLATNNSIATLVGGFTSSKRYEFVNWDDELPNIWKNNPSMFQENHQPVVPMFLMFPMASPLFCQRFTDFLRRDTAATEDDFGWRTSWPRARGHVTDSN